MQTTWVTWAGYQGRYTKEFLRQQRVGVPFFGMGHSVEEAQSKQEIIEILYRELWKDSGGITPVATNALAIWRFEMQIGDWIILPGRFERLYFIGELLSEYTYVPDDPWELYHYRKVHWFARNLPKQAFPESLQNTLDISTLQKPFPLSTELNEELSLLMKYRQ